MMFKASGSNRETIMLFLVVLLAVFRFSYFEFQYIPYLDDYIQYSFYPSYPNPWRNILTGGAGVLFTRPLAGLLDFFVWSRFYDNLGVIVFVISVLYGFSGVFFYKAFKKCGIMAGPVFFAIFLFLPSNIEGTYWISASTRIVVSMFLISAALFAATNGRTVIFLFLNFLSMWFYEQTAILAFFAAALVGLQKKSPQILVAAVTSLVLVTVFYTRFGGMGDNADRLDLSGINDIPKNVLQTTREFLSVLGKVNFKISTKGFVRGFSIIAREFSILWISALALQCVGFLNLSQGSEPGAGKTKKHLFAGAVLAVVPLIPFFITQGVGFNLRNIVPCLLGLGLLADSLAQLLFKKYTALAAAVLIFCFSVSAVSEVRDYNFTARRDSELASKIAQQVLPDTKSVGVRITTPKYYEQNVPYKDHIMSMTGSDWGITGVVRTVSKNRKVVVEIKQ